MLIYDHLKYLNTCLIVKTAVHNGLESLEGKQDNQVAANQSLVSYANDIKNLFMSSVHLLCAMD